MDSMDGGVLLWFRDLHLPEWLAKQVQPKRDGAHSCQSNLISRTAQDFGMVENVVWVFKHSSNNEGNVSEKYDAREHNAERAELAGTDWLSEWENWAENVLDSFQI